MFGKVRALCPVERLPSRRASYRKVTLPTASWTEHADLASKQPNLCEKNENQEVVSKNCFVGLRRSICALAIERLPSRPPAHLLSMASLLSKSKYSRSPQLGVCTKLFEVCPASSNAQSLCKTAWYPLLAWSPHLANICFCLWQAASTMK